jgi:hypothetical protein
MGRTWLTPGTVIKKINDERLLIPAGYKQVTEANEKKLFIACARFPLTLKVLPDTLSAQILLLNAGMGDVLRWLMFHQIR